MKIVVTRPERSGRKTAKYLSDMGHDVLHLPLSYPVHHTTIAQDSLINSLYKSILLTSAESVQVLAKLSLDWENLSHIPVICVGDSTAFAAQSIGFRNVLAANGFATGMIDLMKSMSSHHLTSLQPFLYLAGSPRASTLEDGLINMNISYSVAEIYEMHKHAIRTEDLNALCEFLPDSVMLFSSEAAMDFTNEILLKCNNEIFENTHYLCISKKVSEKLPKSQQTRALISHTPNEQGIIELLPLITKTEL